ncbi:MAG: hypothetical protein V3W22_01570 [Thermoplasmata archaeon]
MAERKLSSIPTWPLDTRILRRLAAIALTVITILVSRSVATQFGL